MKDDENMVVSLRGTTPTPRPHPSSDNLPRKKTSRRRRVRAVIATCVCAVLLGGALGWYVFFRHSGVASYNAAASLSTSTPGSQQQTAAQTAAIIATVGKLIDLPTGETPTVATVTDPSKLQDQPFFANARSGDIVLLYTVAREAYLYDPVQNKLVEVAPITTSVGQQ